MSNTGFIVGHLDIDGFRRPWILFPDGTTELLPHYAYHYTQPNMVNDLGMIAGSASTDHGSHALIWIPTPQPTARHT